LSIKVLLTFAREVVTKVEHGKPETYGPIPDYVTQILQVDLAGEQEK